MVRRRGYSRSTSNRGVTSFGCPLIGKSGFAVAALSVSVPAERLTQESEALIVEALMSTCVKIAELVGPF
jgi:DNA-binding IclR family transcriptional regulator